MSGAHTNEWATYELYQEPYTRRIHGEIDKVLALGKDAYTAQDFTHFDSLHYCGHEWIKEFFDSINIPAGQTLKVLELCSGFGSTARFVASNYPVEITCVDFSPSFNAINSRINEIIGLSNISTMQGDISQLPLGKGFSGEFDVVYSLQSIFHNEDKIPIYAGCFQALKEGGRIYIEDFNIEHPQYVFSPEERVAFDNLHFHSFHSNKGYEQLLKDAGFTIDSSVSRTREWSLYVFERAENFLRIKDQIVRDYGEEVFNSRYIRGIENTPKLYHDLGLTADEVVERFPLMTQHWGKDNLLNWVLSVPQKAGGIYLVGSKA
jgi:phosphoethanolamine N-methyltransferase